MKFEAQSPLELGIEAAARQLAARELNSGGGVPAVDSTGAPLAVVTGVAMAGIDVGGTMLGEPFYLEAPGRPQRQALAVSGVVAEVSHPGQQHFVAAGEVVADALQRHGIVGAGQSTGEQARYRDGSTMSRMESLTVYRPRQDGRAACTVYIVGIPFSMSERDFCTPFLHVGEVVALFFPREEWQDYKPHGTCTIRYRHPQHAEDAVEQFDGVPIYRRLQPLRVNYAEREYGIDPPNHRQENILGKPRYYGSVGDFPIEDQARPDADWARRGRAGA